MLKTIRPAVFICASIAVIVCAGAEQSISFVPDKPYDRRFLPFIDAVKARTGFDVELVTPTGYPKLVEAFVAQKLDMA